MIHTHAIEPATHLHPAPKRHRSAAKIEQAFERPENVLARCESLDGAMVEACTPTWPRTIEIAGKRIAARERARRALRCDRAFSGVTPLCDVRTFRRQ